MSHQRLMATPNATLTQTCRLLSLLFSPELARAPEWSVKRQISTRLSPSFGLSHVIHGAEPGCSERACRVLLTLLGYV